jgi:hypothetical protein
VASARQHLLRLHLILQAPSLWQHTIINKALCGLCRAFPSSKMVGNLLFDGRADRTDDGQEYHHYHWHMASTMLVCVFPDTSSLVYLDKAIEFTAVHSGLLSGNEVSSIIVEGIETSHPNPKIPARAEQYRSRLADADQRGLRYQCTEL